MEDCASQQSPTQAIVMKDCRRSNRLCDHRIIYVVGNCCFVYLKRSGSGGHWAIDMNGQAEVEGEVTLTIENDRSFTVSGHFNTAVQGKLKP